MKIQFLDNIISQEGIEMQIPTNVKAAVSVVKMVDFSTIAESLYQLTKMILNSFGITNNNNLLFEWTHRISESVLFIIGQDFIVGTDHHDLCWLNRWRMDLQQYPFIIEHIKEKHNSVPDCLSRYPVDSPRDYDDNEKQSNEIVVSTKEQLQMHQQNDMLIKLNGDRSQSVQRRFNEFAKSE